MQAAESVLCWVSPGHCHSVFAEGRSMRTFFARGISQHTTAHKCMHAHTRTGTSTEVTLKPRTAAALVRTEADAGEAGGNGRPTQKTSSTFHSLINFSLVIVYI